MRARFNTNGNDSDIQHITFALLHVSQREKWNNSYSSSCMTYTTTQHIMATGNSPKPIHAAMMPMMRAMSPGTDDCVTSMIAGNVITASVTYGT